MKFSFTLFLSLCFGIWASGQAVWTEPVFPAQGDAVTIYYDATQGTGGLAGCNCDIYIHTGLITDASSNPTDWKNVPTQWGVANDDWKLEPVPGEDDLYTYSIVPSIEDFYNVDMGTEVLELAFVFRNADGSLEGKDDGNVDFYYPVYPDNLPFSSLLLSPSSSPLVAELGSTISVRSAVSETATLQLFDNGDLVEEVTGVMLEFDLEVLAGGVHEVEIIADNGSESLTESFTYIVPEMITPADPPAGTEPGITLIGDTSMILLLYAPNKNNIYTLGSFSDWDLLPEYQLQPTVDGNSWWIQIDDLVPGEHVTFQYLVDGSLKIADPYSTLILDAGNDPFIPEETYPDLPEYPDGQMGHVSLVQPGAPEYQWAVTDFERPDMHELTVYELLVRDFIERHDYTTLIDTLDYFTEMGINAIELMPVNEFEGNISWGYNPSYHMALDKYYGPINEFKRFIDSCHARGIAVILDVVYNHAFGQSPLVQMYFDGKPTPESPWFNVDATHPFNVGYDFNHESEATKTFVEKVIRYWLTEFKIDGFRFDLSKGFTQVNNPNDVGAWGDYDESRINILKNYADVCWDASPGVYVILEHFANNLEEKELAEYGMMVWGNIHGDFTTAARGYPANLIGTSYKARGFDDPRIVHYMESHDEERIMYSALQSGNDDNPYHNIQELETALRRIELNSVFFYPVPGPKMLWQFGEHGYDINIDFNGRTGPKPILWDYLDVPERRRLYDVTAALINLRHTYPVFQTEDFDLQVSGPNPKGKTIHLQDADMNVTIIGNFDVWDTTEDPAFQHTGTWYDYFSGDSLVVTDVNEPLFLTPGEYRLFTDVKLPEPPMGYIQVTGLQESPAPDFTMNLYPNPTTDQAFLQFSLSENEEVRVMVFSNQGQHIATLLDEERSAGSHQLRLPVDLPRGNYWVLLQAGSQSQSKQLVVEK